MKAVMISIKPRWCELIASGEKTVEVRKNYPTLRLPFKCYIYETKGKSDVPVWVDEDGHASYDIGGKVICEFVCDEINKFSVGSLYCDDIEKETCLSYSDITDYFKCDGKTSKIGYGWHISDLKIYDKPKELSDFKRYCDTCSFPILPFHPTPCDTCPGRKLTNAPPSWCYVEEAGRDA